jgi:hypothetical protein
VDREYPEAAEKDPRTTLESWLDYEREGVVVKARELADADGAASPVDSGTSITGIVRHLANVERGWFAGAMQPGTTRPEPVFKDAWRVSPPPSLSEAVAGYEAACEQSRAIQREIRSLEQAAPNDEAAGLDYIWVLTHMIEETARHLGHLDLLRELRDGSTGE